MTITESPEYKESVDRLLKAAQDVGERIGWVRGMEEAMRVVAQNEHAVKAIRQRLNAIAARKDK